MAEQPTTFLNPTKLGKLVLAAVIITATFAGLQTYFAALDVSTLPVQVQGFFSVMKYFFTLPLVLFAIAMVRNNWGYIVEWTRSKYKESYDFSKLWTTVAYYVGLIGTVLTAMNMLNAPVLWQTFVAVALVVVDLVKQALNAVDIRSILT